ncbi:MAG: glycosyltransferase, partial [Candidatus Poseidoniales archaeon]|nr:glycosyltransferase [Candidatus Poseidoniales archaeon]
MTIYNGDVAGAHRDSPWIHQSLAQSRIKGFHALSLANSAKKSIANIASGIAIVDWTLASKLAPLLQRNKVPWLLMDRSPPANSGLLALFQWPIWKKSWRLVLRGKAHNGFTVSSAHSKFVSNQLGIKLNKITALEAGVDLELFSTGEKSNQFTLLYHGQLDKNRGILVLAKLIKKLNEGNIAAKLQLIGEGDAFTELQAIANQRDDIEVLPSMSQTKLVQYLSKAHIGLLPMPESGVWALASPLKRSEYAASGLAILGIDHSGHRLEGGEVEWMKLVSQEQFLGEGTNWLKMLANDNSKLEQLKLQARQYAE